MDTAYGGPWIPEACLNRVCSAQRQPPRGPEWVAHELRTTKKFTGKGDVPVVEGLYRDYFEGVTSTATILNFSQLEWGDAEVATLASVLSHYGSLVNLDMSANQIGAEGAKRLSEALKANSTLLKLKYAASPPSSLYMCSLLHQSVSTP